jgi:hypothetical protein
MAVAILLQASIRPSPGRDSRGVFRVYEASIADASWRLWRDAPGFSQRFTGPFSAGGDTIVGRWQLCRDDVHWADDLEITYRRHQ